MKKFFLLYFLLLTCSCSNFVSNRIKNADLIAATHSFEKAIISTDSFSLLTYSKISDPHASLHVYIEGDGFAWRNRHTISHNPTPKNPVSLKLAASDTHPNVLYIARPCQYVRLENNTLCENKFWTGSRFSKSVIQATNDVITHFATKHNVKEISLFGYSGGAAVAVLTASMRQDVQLIGTVAGNLNHKMLMKEHGVSPLDDSLDAIDVAQKVKHIKQFHLIGAKDKIVIPKVILSFALRVNLLGGEAKFKVIDDAHHQYEKWPEVWKNTINR